MTTRQYVKQLRLVTPWTASRMGIKAEAPVFISSWMNRQVVCQRCSVTYSPLVYQTGYETCAQHFCVPGGGIYCHVCADPRMALRHQSGWIAQVEPVGRQMARDDTLQVAAIVDPGIWTAKAG